MDTLAQYECTVLFVLRLAILMFIRIRTIYTNK
jgi:hypothetical protein